MSVAIHHRSELDERAPVFADRAAGGVVLADMLRALPLTNPVILGIPAGGVPVAVEVARASGWPLDVAVVSKITLPWDTEVGYGAVAFDGSIGLNHDLVAQVGLEPLAIEAGTAKTRAKVERRVRRLRGGAALSLEGKTAVLVDDGLASGMTMELAARAVRASGAARVIAAAPTGHRAAVERVRPYADEVVCANLRSSTPFAVADAYQSWRDVSEAEVETALRGAGWRAS